MLAIRCDICKCTPMHFSALCALCFRSARHICIYAIIIYEKTCDLAQGLRAQCTLTHSQRINSYTQSTPPPPPKSNVKLHARTHL